MPARLPNGDKAILDMRKLEDYCLSPSHPRGRHKARVFRHALGLQQGDATWLRAELLKAAVSGDADALPLTSGGHTGNLTPSSGDIGSGQW